MKQINISELQANAGVWVRQAALNQQIIITDQGQPVAALIPISPSPLGRALPDREQRICQRSFIPVDSADYISEMRD